MVFEGNVKDSRKSMNRFNAEEYNENKKEAFIDLNSYIGKQKEIQTRKAWEDLPKEKKDVENELRLIRDKLLIIRDINSIEEYIIKLEEKQKDPKLDSATIKSIRRQIEKRKKEIATHWRGFIPAKSIRTLVYEQMKVLEESKKISDKLKKTSILEKKDIEIMKSRGATSVLLREEGDIERVMTAISKQLEILAILEKEIGDQRRILDDKKNDLLNPKVNDSIKKSIQREYTNWRALFDSIGIEKKLLDNYIGLQKAA